VADLSVEFAGMKFKNPIIVASATPSKDAKYMKRCCEAGAGGIIAKTVTFEEKLQHYVSPRFTVLHKRGWPWAYSNYSAEFLATYTPEQWVGELEEAMKACREHDVRLVGSISGDTLENWAKLARMMEATGVDALECNFGCPHPRDLGYKSGQELGADPDAAAAVTKIVVDEVTIPVGIKLTAEAVDPVLVAGKVRAAGAAYVTVVNRFPALDIDIETGRPLLHSTYAGVGGPWMRPITLKWISKVARAVDVPISATNGVFTWEDVVKMIMVGAGTVQTCTAIMYGTKQLGVIDDFLKGLNKYLDGHGYASPKDIQGITLPQLLPWDAIKREAKHISSVNKDKCNACGFCKRWCFYDAVSFDENKKAQIDPALCDGCGLCPSLCPKDAISMEGKVFLGNFK
jgi:dihydropyrimidine dehydrogenase (NAD+) subunit PreA